MSRSTSLSEIKMEPPSSAHFYKKYSSQSSLEPLTQVSQTSSAAASDSIGNLGTSNSNLDSSRSQIKSENTASSSSQNSQNSASNDQNMTLEQKLKESLQSATGGGPIQLWHFLIELLLDNKMNQIIGWTGNCWEFKIIEPDDVAYLWGLKKNKPNMNYEKLSRGLLGEEILKICEATSFGQLLKAPVLCFLLRDLV